tara:strand:- start:1155 stop:1295 length:141 start_codon:yes stop_codon:yes gene_type:complete
LTAFVFAIIEIISEVDLKKQKNGNLSEITTFEKYNKKENINIIEMM